MTPETIESTASFLDKTDWRITLHRKLEACVDAEGTEYYPQRVRALVSAASAHYPGWDAKSNISSKVSELERVYSVREKNWLKKNANKRKFQKYLYQKQLYMLFCHDVFDYIKNLCAQKRMLLWGTKKISGGTQMPDPD